MKKIILAILITFISLNVSAQSDERENKKDYFNIGLYSGYYRGNPPLFAKQTHVNTLTAELEYFKFTDLSFVFRYLYQFTKAELYDLEGFDEFDGTRYNEPKTSRTNISIMARYYLGGSRFRPYLQAGLNHESNWIGDYSIDYLTQSGETYYTEKFHHYDIHRYSLNIGAGINILLIKKFSLDMNYDIYKVLSKNNGVESYYGENSNVRSGFNGYSFQMGLKYTF